MDDFLTCRALSKKFGDTVVLQNVDFSLGQGQCLALLGSSGCGKSTLLNILSGTLGADAGEIMCGGDTLDAPAKGCFVAPRKRNFAMVFQDFSLWPHMTVAGNVAFGLRVRGISGPRRVEQVNDALERVRMRDFADRRTASLSGGQQQRVSIARALAVRPRLLLLDEPLSALDAKLREAMRREIAAIIKDTGLTAVYVTHDQAEAFTVGDRVALMKDGIIEQMDAPEALYRSPETLFAADFLGASNLLEYERSEGVLRIRNEVETFIQKAESPDSGWLMIRREDVRVEPEHIEWDGSDACAWKGRCVMSEFLGDRHESEIELPGGTRLRGRSSVRLDPNTIAYACFSSRKVGFIKK